MTIVNEEGRAEKESLTISDVPLTQPLEKEFFARQSNDNWQMKRLISIGSCLAVFFGGIAAAFAVCEQISIASDDRHVSVAHSAPDHHSDSPHEHSDGSVVHCPIVGQFVSTAVFSTRPDRGPERLVNPFVADLVFRRDEGEVYRLIHGPPSFASTSGVPSHLFLSVLLI
jgi:hypothetical protein